MDILSALFLVVLSNVALCVAVSGASVSLWIFVLGRARNAGKILVALLICLGLFAGGLGAAGAGYSALLEAGLTWLQVGVVGIFLSGLPLLGFLWFFGFLGARKQKN